jgi:hypothetical protein
MVVDALASLFGNMQLHISKAKINDTNLWATDTLADMFTKKLFIYYSETSPTLHSTSFAKKFTKTGEDFLVAKYAQNMLWEDAILRKVYSMILAHQKYDMTIVDNDCGYLIYDAVA